MFYYLLLYPPFQQRALRFAENEMSTFFLGDITIERVESNLFSRIDFYGLRAAGSAEFGDSITVGHVSVRYRLPSILKKRVNVRNLRVTDINGQVVMAPGNDILLPFLPAFLKDSNRSNDEDDKENNDEGGGHPNPDDWPVKIHIGSVKIEGINAVYRDLHNNMVGEIKNASATAQFHSIDSFSVQLAVPQGSYSSPWWDGTIDTLGASGVITWRNLRVHSMLLEGSGTRVTGGGLLSYFDDDPWDLHANFKTAINPVPILYTYDKGVGRDGILEGTASFKGSLYKPLYSAHVRGRGVKYRGYELGSFNVEADYGADEYGRAKIRGTSAVGPFNVNASLQMINLMRGVEFGNYSVQANLNELDANIISKELRIDGQIPAERGSVRLSASGRDIGIPTFVDLSVQLDGGRLAGAPLNADMVLSNDLWSLNGRWGANRFEGSGRLNSKNGSVSGFLSSRLPDPAAVSLTFSKERVSGLLNSYIDIGGYIHNPTLGASLKGNEIRWRGMEADSADAFLTFEDGKLGIQKIDASISGNVDSVFTFLDLGHLVKGHIEADFSMVGGGEPSDLFLHAQVRGCGLQYEQFSLDSAFGLVKLERDTLIWTDLFLRKGNDAALSRGSIVFGSEIKLDADADLFFEREGIKTAAGELGFNGLLRGDSIKAKYRITSAHLLLLDQWIPQEHRVNGMLSSSGELWGTVANPCAKMEFTVTEPRYTNVKAHRISGRASFSDSLLNGSAQLSLNETAEAVKFSAQLPFLPSSGWKIDETGERICLIKSSAGHLHIGVLAELFGPQYAASGLLAFEVQLSNAGSGWGVGGSVSLPDGEIEYLPLKIHASGVNFSASGSVTSTQNDASFVLRSGIVEMPMLRIENSVVKGHSGPDALIIDEARLGFAGSSYIDLKGALPYAGIDSLMYNNNLKVQYTVKDFPAQFFSTFFPQYGLRKGVFNGTGEIYTYEGRPFVDGGLSLNGLEFSIPDIYPLIGPADAQFEFNGSTIMVTSGQVKWNRGIMRAEGHASWDTKRLYGLSLNLWGGNIAFELPGVIQVSVDTASLHLTDQDEKILINGRAALAPTTYVRDLSIMEMINNMQIRDGIRRAPNPFLESVLLRIDLDLANNMNVNMNLGSLTADGRVALTGSAASPGFVGEVSIIDGYVYYFDRKFKIDEGMLFNADPSVINPNLNIVAKADVSTYLPPPAKGEDFTITLNITGTMENPVVRFEAEPNLSELDILSVLTLGQRMGSVGSDINDRIANIAAQQAIGLGTRRLERILNFDRISVSGDVMGASDSRGASLSVARRLTSRLLLTGETFMGKFSDRKVTAHYRLTPHFYLEGQTTSEGENAVDLIFRFSR
jgi:hypothetical protein